MAEQISSRSDLNVETATDVDALSYAQRDPDISDEINAERVRRALSELRNICDNLSEPERSQLATQIDSIQSQLTSGVNPTQLLATAIPAARVDAKGYQSIETAKSYDNVMDAITLSAVEQARVDRMSNIIFSGESDTAILHKLAEAESWRDEGLPPEIVKSNRDTRISLSGSPEALQDLHTIQGAGEKGKEALEAMAKREHWFKDHAEEAKDEDTRRLMNRMARNAHKFMTEEEFQQFADAFEKGAPASDLKKITEPASQRHKQFRISESLEVIREKSPWITDAIIASAPEEMRAKLSHDNAALAEYIQQQTSSLTEEQCDAVRNKIVKSGYDSLSPEEKKIFALDQLDSLESQRAAMAGAASFITRSYARYEQILKSDTSERTSDEQRLVESIDLLEDKSRPLLERAEHAMNFASKESKRLANAIAKDADSSLALSVLTIAYADQHGGFKVFAEKMQAASKTPPDPEAQAFERDYQRYLSVSLLHDELDLTKPNNIALMSSALEQAGQDLKNGRKKITEQGQFVDRDGYTPRTSIFENGDKFLSEFIGYKELTSSLLEDKGKSAYHEAAKLIQNYQLYKGPQGEALVDSMYHGAKPEDVMRQVQDMVKATRAEMVDFAPIVVAELSPERKALLEQKGILKDGQINIDALIKAADDLAPQAEKWPQDQRDKFQKMTDDERKAYDVEHKLPQDGKASIFEMTVVRNANYGILAIKELEDIRRIGTTLDGLTSDMDPARVKEDNEIYDKLKNPATPSNKRLEALTLLLKRDSYLGAEGREKVLNTTAAQLNTYLEEHPDYLTQQSSKVYNAAVYSKAETPAASADPAVSGTVAPVQVQGPSQPATLDKREEEGSTGMFDNLYKTDLEKAVLSVVQNMSTEVRLEALGGFEKIQQANGGDKGFLSFNEIENALKQLQRADGKGAISSPEDIKDVNGNGFDIVDIQAALQAVQPKSPTVTPDVAAAAPAAPATEAAPAISNGQNVEHPQDGFPPQSLPKTPAANAPLQGQPR